MKIEGIKSVDFKIEADGYGAVNWNGKVEIVGDSGKTMNNHAIPKLRGYTNLSGKVKEETGYKYKKEASDIDFKENPLYISQNCIRHHLFKDQSYDIHYAGKKNVDKLLNSISGLIRGYVVPSCSLKRTSPLLMEDLVDTLGNGNFEQFGNAGEKNENSIFSKTTFGKTHYIGYGSINIELLQFISLDAKFDSQAMIINDGEGEKVAEDITNFIRSISNNTEAKATFHPNYVRKGTIYNQGCQGILLNNAAIMALVNETISMIDDLYIQQAKGWMQVSSVLVDFNDGKPMRIRKDEGSISEIATSDFAVYYEAKDIEALPEDNDSKSQKAKKGKGKKDSEVEVEN
jgi:hypothetical protein